MNDRAGRTRNTSNPGDRTFDPRKLQRSLRRPRSLLSVGLTSLTATLTVAALLPLFSVIYMLAWEGSRRLSWNALTKLPPVAFQEGGGFGNAIVGTLMMVSIAALISVPVGVLGAIFLAEIGPGTRIAKAVQFSAKVLTGFPSILAGVFVYGAIVFYTKTYSSLAGAVALSVLMLPTIMLTAEEAIRMVPRKMREAAIGMGATQAQAVRYILLPTSIPGILTGVMLAVARAAGETAPLLFTALFSNYWLTSGAKLSLAHPRESCEVFLQPTASLAVLIYNFSAVPFENQKELAWTAALVLVLIVLTINLIGQAFSRRSVQNSR